MPQIELQDVDSSNIKQYGYDRKTQTIRIIFLNGVGYDYPMTDPNVWKRFQAAESKGSFLNREIKPFYGHRRMRESELEHIDFIDEDAALPTSEQISEVIEKGGDPYNHTARIMFDIPSDQNATQAQLDKAKKYILALSYGGDKDATRPKTEDNTESRADRRATDDEAGSTGDEREGAGDSDIE